MVQSVKLTLDNVTTLSALQLVSGLRAEVQWVDSTASSTYRSNCRYEDTLIYIDTSKQTVKVKYINTVNSS